MTLNKRVENYILWLNRLRAARRRTTALVLALSLVVSGNVFWLMKGVGTALEDEPSCGLTEHSHTEECYEKVLICEEDHEHTDECYETRLICGMEEHTHTDACYISAVLERENQADWEKTLPQLTGTYSSDLMACAVSQTGYEENADGYTRYGDWYGNPTGDWNVMFVSFCMHYAGISNDQIPSGSGCWAWQVKLEESGLISDMSVLPMPGDILLTDNDGDGKYDRAGIIADVAEGMISTIEGDVDGKVGACSYSAEDAALFGYVSVNSLNINTDGSVDVTDGADAQSENTDAQPMLEFSATTESGIEVKATAPEGAFPEGVTMSARDVDDEDVISSAESAVAEDKVVKGSIAVDITFTDSEGNETEPFEGFAVEVNIMIPEEMQLDAGEYQLFHIGDEGAEEVEGAVVSQSEAQFTAEGFSIYVVTGTGEKDQNNVHAFIAARAGMDDQAAGHLTPDNKYILNDIKFPYILLPGETVELIGTSSNGDAYEFVEYPNRNGGNLSITQTNVGGKVTATVTALRACEVAVQLVDAYGNGIGDLDESCFSIRVLPMEDKEVVINLDDPSFPQWTTVTFDVNYLDKVTVIGTPDGDNYPYLDNGVNPQGWVLSTSDTWDRFEENGRRGFRFTADRYDRNGQNENTVYFITAYGAKGVRIVEHYPYDAVWWDYYKYLDHADIEIADGGVYSNTSFEIGENGEILKITTEYQSFVSKVNSCTIKGADGNPVLMSQEDENHVFTRIEGCTGFETSDYWHDPDFYPGDSQYELTSKYTLPAGYRWDEHKPDMSDKRFLYQDVKSVVFDVGMHIVPTLITKEKWDPDLKDWIPYHTEEYHPQYDQDYYTKVIDGVADPTHYPLTDPETDTDSIMQTVDRAIFDLGERYIIDAYNKCPNHSGLDFTVHANLATVTFGATKELTNGKLQDGDFTFLLVDENGNVVSKVNDINGKVTFDPITFDKPGVHTYTLKEKRDAEEQAKMPNVIFSEKEYVVHVTISEKPNSGGMLEANIVVEGDDYSFKFINNVKFKMPDTGGGGIVPYLAVGTVLIGSAITLLMLGRRKEVDL